MLTEQYILDDTSSTRWHKRKPHLLLVESAGFPLYDYAFTYLTDVLAKMMDAQRSQQFKSLPIRINQLPHFT